MPDGWNLNDTGKAILAHGGADGMSDDDMLVLEIASRMPGAGTLDLQSVFIALREEYGEDALQAVRTGHVRFELQSTRDMGGPAGGKAQG